MRDRRKELGGTDLLVYNPWPALFIHMFFQQFGKTDDRIHGRPDIMTHIEEEARFASLASCVLLRRFFQLLCMHLVPVTPQLKLPVTQRHENGQRNYQR